MSDLNNSRLNFKKQQEQEAKEIKEYRDRFWSEAQNTPTRPESPLK